MIPISEEKINRIEDFVSHMTDEQVKEWLKEFKKKQYNLAHYFEFAYTVFANGEAGDVAKRSFIFIIKCFETYNVPIPLVNVDELKRWGKEWQKVTDRIATEELYGYKLLHVGEDINQLPITKHLFNKFIIDRSLESLFTDRKSTRLN